MVTPHVSSAAPFPRRHLGAWRALLAAACACFVARPAAAQCIVSTIAGGGTSGSLLGSAGGLGTAALFSSPWGVAVDADGTLWVADYNNHKIRRVTPSGAVTTVAGGGVIGNLTGSLDGTGTAALFSYPIGVAVDKNGTLYVVDQGNNKLRRITPGGAVTTLAGGNTTGVQAGNVDGVGTAAMFHLPRSITIDSNGTLYVADSGNSKLRRIMPSGAVSTVAGGGASGVVDGIEDGVGTAALFFTPYGVAVDANGTLS